jgi:diguanylate cyclase (GGDEF)-like protein
VAQILSQSVTRARDLIARFGGEEFVIVLPETDAVAARTIAERCQYLMQQANVAHQKSEVSDRLTISIGVNTIIPSQKDDLFEFIDKTDKQLYQAKQNGRNLIV